MIIVALFPSLRNEADTAFISSSDPPRLYQLPYLFRASQPSSLSFPSRICRFTPRQSSSQNILENAFPIILFSGISSRIGRRIPQLPAGIELAETSLRMFLEEGLDPFRSVFDLHIPDSPALLEPDGKTGRGRMEAVPSGQGSTPK